jgi:HSP20 family molecular chaperone IbpA
MAIRKRQLDSDSIDEYFRDLEEWTEDLERTMIGRPSWNQKACTIEPLRNIRVAPTEVVVTADLPLTKEEAVKIKPIDDQTLEISAQMKRRVHFKEFGIFYHRGEFHSFHCYIRIPVPVRMNKMKTRFKKGMLEIHLPRRLEQVTVRRGKRSLRQ